MRTKKIMVVDDERLIRWTLEQKLSREGYEVITAEKGQECLDKVKEDLPDLLILDLRLPDIDGLTLLQTLRETDKNLVIIMMTAHGGVESAVQAMKMGVFDYISKPFDYDELKIVVEKALETAHIRKELERLRSEQLGAYGFQDMVVVSRPMQQVLDMVKKLIQSEVTTVLLQGESGTGKDLVAKIIHYQSNRNNYPYMTINCAALPENLLESELFGHERGAFTDAKATKKGLLELADGGTVFLDEIGDMNASLQAKVLRVLEDKIFKRVGGIKDIKVDIRIIAASNRDLEKAIQEGNFRQDLFYRLKVFPLYLPPLRERKEEIMPLIYFFLERFNKEFKRNIKGVASLAQKFLMQYPWPGNVRELRNVLERALILGSGDTLLVEHLPLEIVAAASRAEPLAGDYKLPLSGIVLEDLEKDLVCQALDLAGGNQVRAAKLLSISRDAFRNRMKKFGLL